MVVLITGANKGIGFAVAKLFQSKGYKVIIAGRNEQRLISAKEKLGENVDYVVWDVAAVKTSPIVIQKAHSIWGNIDIFINNAGIVCCWYNPKGIKNETNLRIDYEVDDLQKVVEILS